MQEKKQFLTSKNLYMFNKEKYFAKLKYISRINNTLFTFPCTSDANLLSSKYLKYSVLQICSKMLLLQFLLYLLISKDKLTVSENLVLKCF